METITLDQLTENLKKWRSDREIDTKSTAEAQYNCYLEELDELKDAIGDSVVCLLNCEAMGGGYFGTEIKIDNLQRAAYVCGVEFEECLTMAWNEIKDRVGLMRDNGKFTKWKDLAHEERLKVIDSGQFDDKSVDFVGEHIKNDYINEDESYHLETTLSVRFLRITENGK